LEDGHVGAFSDAPFGRYTGIVKDLKEVRKMIVGEQQRSKLEGWLLLKAGEDHQDGKAGVPCGRAICKTLTTYD